MKIDVLITDALIVTCDSNHSIVENGVLGITNGKLSLLAKAGEFNKQGLSIGKTISADGSLVMPGLINMHCHAADSLFRGLVENLPLEQWLQKVWVAEKNILTPETTYTGSLLGLIENLIGGVTTVMDMFWYPSETVKAAKCLGMRIATGGIFFDLPAIGDRKHADFIAEAKTFYEQFSDDDDVIAVSMPHGTYTVSPEHLKDAYSLSVKYDGLFCTHAAETLFEQSDIRQRYGNTVIQHLAENRLLGCRTTLAHCVHLDEKEISVLKQSNTNVVLNPMSNLKLGSGIAPILELSNAGVNLTIGTDGAISGNDLDMWLAMRLVAGLPRGVSMQADALSAKQVLHMSTLNAALALNRYDDLGSIEIGKFADLIFIDIKNAHATPMFDPITHLVFGTNRSDVTDVFVRGRQIMKDKQIQNIDVLSVYEKVHKMADEIANTLKH